MGTIRIHDGDLSEDGHPCEAALQFRRAAIRMGAADEISGDALDLAVAFAWIGKAVSRTDVAAEWCVNGIDPNTYLVIPLLSTCGVMRAQALQIATSSPAAAGRERDLGRIRATSAFAAASGGVKMLTKSRPGVRDMIRLSELRDISMSFPEAERRLLSTETSGNVVLLDTFRTRRQAGRFSRESR